MISKTVTYTDFNGKTRTETAFFHLFMAEIAEMELTTEGGLGDRLKKLIDSKDQPALVRFFMDLVRKSYGEKSDDGRRFMKEDKTGWPLWKGFVETEMYNQIIMEFITDDVAASEFVKGIIPSEEEQAAYKAKQAALQG